MSFPFDLNEPVSAFFRLNFPYTFGLSKAGVITPFFQTLPTEGGKKVSLRFWTRDTTSPEADTGSNLTFYSGASKNELAYVTRKARPRKEPKIYVQALGAEPGNLDKFAAESTEYWAYWVQYSFWKALAGIFDPSAGILLSTHVKATYETSGTPRPATRAAISLTKAKLGDQSAQLKVMICHSSVATDLKAEALEKDKLPYDPNGYEGMVVIEDDNVPTLGGSGDFILYPTFLFAPGSLGLALQQDLNTEMAWDPDTNTYKMVQSMAYAPHVFGCSFTGTPASEESGPTDTEFATAGNWTKRVNALDKDIKVACLISNIAKR